MGRIGQHPANAERPPGVQFIARNGLGPEFEKTNNPGDQPWPNFRAVRFFAKIFSRLSLSGMAPGSSEAGGPSPGHTRGWLTFTFTNQPCRGSTLQRPPARLLIDAGRTRSGCRPTLSRHL
jgi:hypothetical protein